MIKIIEMKYYKSSKLIKKLIYKYLNHIFINKNKLFLIMKTI